MSEKRDIKPYRKEMEHSYALGAFAVYELLSARPQAALAVYAHSSYTEAEKLTAACQALSVPLYFEDRPFERLRLKGNNYVFAVCGKYACELRRDKNHVLLVNPGDTGNLGTITRTMTAFGYGDLAIISPAVDVFDPKTIRASMGALFKINVQYFDSFELYRDAHPGHKAFPFMTDGGTELSAAARDKGPYNVLIFGNEAAGLPEAYRQAGGSVRIPQSGAVDSLNLSIAAGIGLFCFQ